MAQASCKWKEPALELLELTPSSKRAESCGKDSHNADAQLDDVCKSWSKHILRLQAVDPEKINEVGRCQVKVNVLEAQEQGEEYTTVQHGRLFPCEDNRQKQDAIEKAVILEMDVVDD